MSGRVDEKMRLNPSFDSVGCWSSQLELTVLPEFTGVDQGPKSWADKHVPHSNRNSGVPKIAFMRSPPLAGKVTLNPLRSSVNELPLDYYWTLYGSLIH
jgi:hypothetical protein